MLKKRVIGGLAAMASNRLAMVMVQLALVPILANCWHIATYGVWVMASTIPALMVFADLGFATAAGTAIAMQLEKGEVAAAAATYRNAFGVGNLIGATIISAGTLAAFAIPAEWLAPTVDLPDSSLRLMIVLFAVYTVVAMQSSICFAAIRATGRTSLAVNFQTAAYIAENAIVAAIALSGGTPLAAAFGMAASRTAFAIAQACVLQRKEPWVRFGLLWQEWEGVKRLAAPANAAMVGASAMGLLLQGTVLMLGAATSAALVPIFTSVRTLSRTGTQLTAIVSATIMPEFSRASAAENRRLLAKFLALTLGSATVTVLPFAIVLGVFGREIVLIWTKGAIDPPALLMWVMAIGTLFNGLWTPVSNLLIARQMQGQFTYHLLALSLLAIPATYLLAPSLGVVAPALCLLVVDGVLFLIVFRLLRQLPFSMAELQAATAELFRQTIGKLGFVRSNR